MCVDQGPRVCGKCHVSCLCIYRQAVFLLTRRESIAALASNGIFKAFRKVAVEDILSEAWRASHNNELGGDVP